ncbi:nucleotidyltransferase domain-containing protein [Flavobacterium sp. CYK-4]|uniref:nucleotidyltransferase domain-containing protein n=1 Tax=Flavobacterium lotistagni TaxID=2709660 RepID=UPI001408B150|nr:nucleotidyltransferase domain-containing protein [Flavobacterium lotistagni]NHM05877.1 nucleotidyltransferase domain-containing protein [Flavobacterium lotistagni]
METLKTILYFSIFKYPLKKEEIHSYTNHIDMAQTEAELQSLVADKILMQVDDFYVYGSDLDCVPRRLKGNVMAQKAIVIAQRKAALIAKFPFVEAVGISGSLSKGYYDKDSDIDFFVVTRPNKLWICRTFLILYKKIFLLNSRKYFCVNYFISSAQLKISEQNRFTATEIKTLIPLQGDITFAKFYAENNWVNDYFQSFRPDLKQVARIKKPYFTAVLELLLNNFVGHGIDYIFRCLTLFRWHAKFDYLADEDFRVALKSTKNVSKHHPSNFQKKVLLSLNAKLEEVRLKFNLALPKEHV